MAADVLATSQGISNYDIDLIKPSWLSSSTLRVLSNMVMNVLEGN